MVGGDSLKPEFSKSRQAIFGVMGLGSLLVACSMLLSQVTTIIAVIWHFSLILDHAGVSFGWWYVSSWGIEANVAVQRQYLRLPTLGRYDIPLNALWYVYVPWWLLLPFALFLLFRSIKVLRSRITKKGFPVE